MIAKRPQPRDGPTGPEAGAVPADAIVFFDGKDLSQWEGGNASGIEDGCINILKTGQITPSNSLAIANSTWNGPRPPRPTATP